MRIIGPNFWGWVADRTARRARIIAITIAMGGVCFSGLFFVRSFWGLFTLLIATGFFRQRLYAARRVAYAFAPASRGQPLRIHPSLGIGGFHCHCDAGRLCARPAAGREPAVDDARDLCAELGVRACRARCACGRRARRVRTGVEHPAAPRGGGTARGVLADEFRARAAVCVLLDLPGGPRLQQGGGRLDVDRGRDRGNRCVPADAGAHAALFALGDSTCVFRRGGAALS